MSTTEVQRFPCDRQPATEGETACGAVVVIAREQRTTKAGKPYAVLALGNMHGRFEHRVWSEQLAEWDGVTEGTPLEVDCTSVPGYRGGHEWQVVRFSRLPVSHQVADETLPPCPVPSSQLYKRARAVLVRCSPRALALLHVLLHTAVRWADGLCEPIAYRLRRWPAAVSHHHATQGGLWWHTVQVMEGATAMAIALGGDGPLSISYDAVALGALLHDVGKGDELRASGGITAAGRQATHVLWGALRLQSAWDRAVADGWRPGAADEALLTEILHVVASHHGTLEWGANTRPISREAWLVHCADLASAHVEKVDNACRLGTEVEPGWVRPVAGWSRDAYRVISAPSTEDTTAADVESVLRSLGGSGAMPHAPAHDVITQETEPNTGSGHSDDDSPQTHAPTLKLWHGRPTPVGIALATITNTTEA